MKISGVVIDKSLYLDGVHLRVDFTSLVASNVRAIHLNTATEQGSIEYSDGTIGGDFYDGATATALINAFNTEKARLEAEYQAWYDSPEQVAFRQDMALKAQEIEDNLPTWQQISDAIDNATTVAALKVIVKKMARILYWLAKNKST